jgi:hypothetical protein
MTDDPSEVAPSAGDDRDARLRALLTVDLPERTQREIEAAGVAPERTAPARRWPWTSIASAVVLVALFAAGTALAYAGTRIIRSSTVGEVVEPVDDPAAPGYEAFVEPTPTLAVLHDSGGSLDAITVLALSNADEGGGGVVIVPTRVVDDLPLFGVAPLETAYDLGSTPQVQGEIIGDLLGIGIDEVVVVDAARWEGLVEPVALLVLRNPTDLEVDGEVVFPAGEIELAASEVAPYLEVRSEEESELARLFRHQLVWRAWIEAVAEAGTPDAVPGELESGLGSFVRRLAEGEVEITTLPVERSAAPAEGDEPTYVPDVPAIEALVADLVPFPRSPRPGERARVRVLSGTEDVQASRRVAGLLPPVGTEVVIVGNATSLDQETTTIAYVGPEHRETAEEIRDVLGVGEVLVDPRPSDVVDITVTLGADHD